MQRTFVTYLLYQHSQYTAFYRPNKTEVMIITPGKSGDLKISKTDVKRAVAGQSSKKTKENKHSAVIPGCSAKNETLYCD